MNVYENMTTEELLWHLSNLLRREDDSSYPRIQGKILGFLYDHPAQTLTDISEMLNIRAPSAAETVNKLATKKLIKRERDKTDGRRFLYSLTAEGMKHVKSYRQKHLNSSDTQLIISQSERDQINALLIGILIKNDNKK